MNLKTTFVVINNFASYIHDKSCICLFRMVNLNVFILHIVNPIHIADFALEITYGLGKLQFIFCHNNFYKPIYLMFYKRSEKTMYYDVILHGF